MKRIVLTGPSASGKTSTLTHLSGMGYKVMPEVARPLLGMHIDDTSLVQNMMIYAQMYAESIQSHEDSIFFDRGVWDYVGFSKELNVHIPWNLYDHVERIRYDKVFYLEPLSAFVKDNERIENSIEESLKYSSRVLGEYQKAGYDVTRIPAVSVDERVDMILNECNLKKG
jgi:predicted ATPase